MGQVVPGLDNGVVGYGLKNFEYLHKPIRYTLIMSLFYSKHFVSRGSVL